MLLKRAVRSVIYMYATNKMSVRPAKTQISLGIRQVWSESSLSAWWKLGSLSTHWAHRVPWVLDKVDTRQCRYALIGPHHEKTCFAMYANNKGADQPAHPHSLISTFVVRYLDSIIPTLAKSKLSRLACRLVWVLPGRKPCRQVFSWRGSITGISVNGYAYYAFSCLSFLSLSCLSRRWLSVQGSRQDFFFFRHHFRQFDFFGANFFKFGPFIASHINLMIK